MNKRPAMSAKGYYYDLEQSPYVYVSPYGDSYKLPSRKRLEMMHKYVSDEVARIDKFLEKRNISDHIPEEIKALLKKYTIQAIYDEIIK